MKTSSKPVNQLLQWYDQNYRVLPWNLTSDPYRIWVSEVILQQTQVKQALGYYDRFINRFPDVYELSKAQETDVLKMWEGLGYYSRARNLHKGAKYIVDQHDGQVPTTRVDLLKVPGIGPYTSAAIQAFAFGFKAAAIDGNLLRIVTRLFAFPGDISKSKVQRAVEGMCLELMKEAHPAKFNRAMMDLGATICKPQNPLCEECPFCEFCEAKAIDQVKDFPFSSKKVKKTRRALHYRIETDNHGALMVYRRVNPGIWKGLYELTPIDVEHTKKLKKIHHVRHLLTHQTLDIHFYIMEGEQVQPSSIDMALAQYAFPRPIQKFLNQLLQKPPKA